MTFAAIRASHSMDCKNYQLSMTAPTSRFGDGVAVSSARGENQD
jgi:hypothetical protein